MGGLFSTTCGLKCRCDQGNQPVSSSLLCSVAQSRQSRRRYPNLLAAVTTDYYPSDLDVRGLDSGIAQGFLSSIKLENKLPTSRPIAKATPRRAKVVRHQSWTKPPFGLFLRKLRGTVLVKTHRRRRSTVTDAGHGSHPPAGPARINALSARRPPFSTRHQPHQTYSMTP